jgi:predicted nucleic acid-binding protein
MILVDTSVLVDFFKGKVTSPTERFREIETGGIPFALPLVCGQELLQGARDEREWKLLRRYLGTQRLLDVNDGWSSYAEAARIFYDCRRRGITVRSSTDCLIGQIALENESTLLHDDDDFESIAEVRPLKTLR